MYYQEMLQRENLLYNHDLVLRVNKQNSFPTAAIWINEPTKPEKTKQFRFASIKYTCFAVCKCKNVTGFREIPPITITIKCVLSKALTKLLLSTFHSLYPLDTENNAYN
jgi:hypothetical protein